MWHYPLKNVVPSGAIARWRFLARLFMASLCQYLRQLESWNYSRHPSTQNACSSVISANYTSKLQRIYIITQACTVQIPINSLSTSTSQFANKLIMAYVPLDRHNLTAKLVNHLSSVLIKGGTFRHRIRNSSDFPAIGFLRRSIELKWVHLLAFLTLTSHFVG